MFDAAPDKMFNATVPTLPRQKHATGSLIFSQTAIFDIAFPYGGANFVPLRTIGSSQLSRRFCWCGWNRAGSLTTE